MFCSQSLIWLWLTFQCFFFFPSGIPWWHWQSTEERLSLSSFTQTRGSSHSVPQAPLCRSRGKRGSSQSCLRESKKGICWTSHVWDLSSSCCWLQPGERSTPGGCRENSSWGGDPQWQAVQLCPHTRDDGGEREGRKAGHRERSVVWNGAQALSQVFDWNFASRAVWGLQLQPILFNFLSARRLGRTSPLGVSAGSRSDGDGCDVAARSESNTKGGVKKHPNGQGPNQRRAHKVQRVQWFLSMSNFILRGLLPERVSPTAPPESPQPWSAFPVCGYHSNTLPKAQQGRASACILGNQWTLRGKQPITRRGRGYRRLALRAVAAGKCSSEAHPAA